jgi:hypothetical protein
MTTLQSVQKGGEISMHRKHRRYAVTAASVATMIVAIAKAIAMILPILLHR